MKKILKVIILLIAGIISGFALLMACYMLPTRIIDFHLTQSLPLIESEFLNSETILGYPATLTGSFTDCLMLEHAVYHSPNHNTLEQALMMYRGESSAEDGWAPGESLSAYLTNKPMAREVDYARYWHGYLVILKPLLIMTNLPTLRMMGGIAQYILLGAFLWLCYSKKIMPLGFSFCVSALFLYLFSLYFSLSLSICFYILMAAVMVQVKWHEQFIKKKWYLEFFLIVGMCTSYFDFLTYPIVTLGMPLCIYLYLNKNNNWLNSTKDIILQSISWSIGYLGMWAGKWIVTDILLGKQVIWDAVSTVLTRTDKVENTSLLASYKIVLEKNIGAYINWPFLLLGFGIVIIVLKLFVINKKRLQWKQILLQSIPFLLVALYPFLWLLATQNHAEQHWIYTCKNLAITVFAVLVWTISVRRQLND